MKDLRPIKGKFYIAGLIAEGEHEHQDFKHSISDARKIARSISAFANNDGGRLLIGVKDNGAIAGVRDEEDIFVVEQAAQMYCSPEVELTFTAFRVEGAQTVIRAEIARSEVRPVRVIEADGRVRAYYRVADENIVAHPLMVRMWESERVGVLLRMGDAERRIASLLDNRRERPMSVDEIARGAHISQRTAEDAIVRLAGMGVVGFAYSGGSFGIILTDSDEATADTPR